MPIEICSFCGSSNFSLHAFNDEVKEYCDDCYKMYKRKLLLKNINEKIECILLLMEKFFRN
jgi:hypothetical protein